MTEPTTPPLFRQARREWAETTLQESLARLPERQAEFTTLSGLPVDPVALPAGLEDYSRYMQQLNLPGQYPFTRGIHTTGYRGRLWTMRMFAGFGSAEETNQRFKYLLAQGQTGLSVAFDLPTLYGYDTDAPEALGEFGKCGVAVSSLRDMEILLDGLPLERITTSMTINGPAAVIWAMFIAVADQRGVPRRQLGGTLQNDILKEYMAQKEYIFPPNPSMRLVTDTIEFAARELPRWNPVSISGYHIREAGSTAVQELAFTLANGMEYVRWAMARSLPVDDFAPRLSFFFNAHTDFFEEIAKYRAARRIWARIMREQFGATNPRSWLLRFHTQTAGVSLTARQPENNLVRVTLQALAAVLGGTQSLHTNSMDEALALPSEHAVKLALRTQQIIAHESGVVNTVDPLGGSYFLEQLTDRLEAEALAYFEKIDHLGGVIPALETGYFQREIAAAAHRTQREIDAGQQIIVGVNAYESDEPVRIPILAMDPAGYERQCVRLAQVRAKRDHRAVEKALTRLKTAAQGTENLMPPILEAVKSYATLQEIVDVLRAQFGQYREPTFI
jgi:methylmalonyl-CoA mutase N-terminal domain/subunit